MSRVSLYQAGFNGGELSPLMFGRADHAVWPISLASMVGFAPRPQGPAQACPGFALVEVSEEGRFIPFEPLVTQGYTIDAREGVFRFYTNDALLRDGAEAVVEVPHDYTLQQLWDLDYEQSNDVLYLYHRDVRTQQLVRIAADEFVLEDVPMENGPFLDRNGDESHTLSVSGVAGSVTVTSNQPLFAATDVGRLIEIEAHDLSDIPSWEPGITVNIGQALAWDGRVYVVVGKGAAGRTGTVAPVHTRGVEWDGLGSGEDINEKDAGGVKLLYAHDYFGRLRITGYTSATAVTATVTRPLPRQTATSYTSGSYVPDYFEPDAGFASGDPFPTVGTGTYTEGSWRWRLGAFSDTTGWPAHGRIWQQRHVLAKDNSLYGSVAGALNDFDRLNEFGEISLDQAFTVTIDDPNEIRWLHVGAELFIGSAVAEYTLRAASAAQGVGPGNLKLDRHSWRGSQPVRPVDLGGRPVFVQKSARRVLHLIEDTYGRYASEDLTRYADHIGNSRFVDFAWQREPMQLLWAVREDGTLAAADYMPVEQVLGWFRRPLAEGLSARSICAITGPDGKTDQIWLKAETDDGQWFDMLMGEWPQPGEWPDLPVMCDAALTYDGSSGAIDTIDLPHLEGRTIEVVGDGQFLGEFEVPEGGAVELPQTVTTAMAGLPFQAYFDMLPVEGGGDNGPAQFKQKRISRFYLRLQNSLGVAVRDAGGKTTEVENTFPGTDLTVSIPPINRDVPVDVVSAWDRAQQFRVIRNRPFPVTVLCVMAELETSQR